jgi:hypothetical protein
MELDLGELQLDAFHVVDLAVRQPDGSPQSHPVVQLLDESLGSGRRDPPLLASWHGERNGRLRLLLPNGKMALAIEGGKGLFTLLAIELLKDSPREQPLVVTLEAMVRVAGVVKNHNGLPLPGASLHISGGSQQGGGPPVPHRRAIEDRNQRWLTGTTDEKGCFELFYIPLPNTGYQITATLVVRGESYRTNVPLHVMGTAIENAELELDCPDELAAPSSKRRER